MVKQKVFAAEECSFQHGLLIWTSLEREFRLQDDDLKQILPVYPDFLVLSCPSGKIRWIS